MLEWVTVDKARIAAGNEFVLARHDDAWVVRVDGRMLMSSRMHHSEVALADLALERAEDPERVLVGGLGLGFTLRAVLDQCGPKVAVTVAEIVPELVAWNRTHLAHLHDRALEDTRVEIAVGDVHETLRRSRGRFDVILLDVDNGPMALSQDKNALLYTDRGVRTCVEALTPGGVLAVWSVGPSTKYERRLEAAGLDVEVRKVAAREGAGAKHVVFLATRR